MSVFMTLKLTSISIVFAYDQNQVDYWLSKAHMIRWWFQPRPGEFELDDWPFRLSKVDLV